jgi:predicted N-acetyltransferase YhbS
MIHIRLLQPEDIPQLAHLYAQAYSSQNTGEIWSIEAANKLLTFAFKRQPDLLFVAKYDDQVAGGILAAVEPGWDGNHLVDCDLFVGSKFQHQGVGKTLFRALVTEAKKTYKITGIDIYTFKGRDYPLSWYKKISFTENNAWVMIAAKPEDVLARL